MQEVIIDASYFVAYYLYYEDYKHSVRRIQSIKNSYLFLKYINRVMHLAILRKYLLQSMCQVNYWISSSWIQWQFNYNYQL